MVAAAAILFFCKLGLKASHHHASVSEMICMVQGWGLLSQFSLFRYFPHFPLLLKQALAIEYRVYVWQVSPQRSCGDTCQI